MRRVVWTFGWIGVAIWSLFCALAYGLFDLVGRGFMRGADAISGSPEMAAGLSGFFGFLHSFSTGAVTVIWAIVSLMILAVPWTLDRMVGSVVTVRMSTSPPASRTGPGFDGPGGVIDLPPDQYSVSPGAGTTPGVPPGVTPRIPPRP
ncbi:hypothetical protein [Enterovirga sp.]|uniref:hypothetical protein n=1 Tax=Enterovirga sp. TaxID=2026350 RepID=UPI002C8D9082|nr:hypothetical protein [Enterovirga sp.]HMO30593.1 hypothetical protein [Enterovirga sp.]